MIGIVHIGNIEYCPYLEKYTRVLEENNLKYEVLFWNREESQKEYLSNYIPFNKKMKNRKKKIYKVFYFIQFRKWMKKHILNGKYDKLIILDTLSGILISKELVNEFAGKYIFDIRDYSYEKFKLFYKREEKIIHHSYFACISSEGFKIFLPQNYDYLIVNNFNYNDIVMAKSKFCRKKSYGETINFVWIGSVRYYNHQINIINRLANDSRYNIIYHGIGPDLERLKEYVKMNKVQNVTFTGKYSNNEKISLLLSADIIHNSYDIKMGHEVKYAISNKYYDGIIYKTPQFVESNTFKSNKVESSGVGIALDTFKEDFANTLYAYYFNIDEDKFNKNCEKELSNILKEDKIYLDKIREFVLG